MRSARAREGVWEFGRVQLQVQRLAASCCESLRASQPPERCGPVPRARRRRIYPNTEKDTRACGELLHHVRPPFSNCACDSPAPRLCCVSLHLVTDRNHARSFTAQVMGPSRAPPHPLGILHKLCLKFSVLELPRGFGDDERRAHPWCAPLQVSSHLHISPSLSSYADQPIDQPCSPRSGPATCSNSHFQLCRLF